MIIKILTKNEKKKNMKQVWWYMPVILVLWKLKQDNSEFETSLGNTVRLFQKFFLKNIIETSQKYVRHLDRNKKSSEGPNLFFILKGSDWTVASLYPTGMWNFLSFFLSFFLTSKS
jgi:hypothetical protein